MTTPRSHLWRPVFFQSTDPMAPVHPTSTSVRHDLGVHRLSSPRHPAHQASGPKDQRDSSPQQLPKCLKSHLLALVYSIPWPGAPFSRLPQLSGPRSEAQGEPRSFSLRPLHSQPVSSVTTGSSGHRSFSRGGIGWEGASRATEELGISGSCLPGEKLV